MTVPNKSYGERANYKMVGDDSVEEALEMRGFSIIDKKIFTDELTDFLTMLLSMGVIKDEGWFNAYI